MENVDVVVIGGGMAGTAAALAAAQAGARVMLIAAAPGATALCCGGWAGPLPEPLAAAFSAAGHGWHAVGGPMPMADGSLRRFDFAAASHDPIHPGSALVCGIAGLPGFHASALARLWPAPGGDLGFCDLVLRDTPRAGWAPASLAARLERDCTDLAEALCSQVKATRADALILPPVLGLENTGAVRDTLAEAAGVPVVEALSQLPSVPGWRLQAALERMLRAHRVTWRAGRVSADPPTHQMLDRVGIEHDGTTTLVQARAFVLATGKFIGGGMTGDRALREPALGCPIRIDHLGESFDTVEPLTLTNAERLEQQPLLEAGVHCDAEGRPLTPAGGPIYKNVWTAGAVRRGAGGTLGHAAAEGWSAGAFAAA